MSSQFGNFPVYSPIADTPSLTLSGKKLATQITSTSTAVELNAGSGTITTFAQTAAADAKVTFTLTNSYITADSIVLLTPIYATGQTGTPVVSVSSLAAGSAVIDLTNSHGSAALNDVVQIQFIVM